MKAGSVLGSTQTYQSKFRPLSQKQCLVRPSFLLTTIIRAGSLLNRQNYKSIELFENVNPDLIDLLKKFKRSDAVRVLVIRK